MKTPKHFKRTELFLATCLITGSFAPVAMVHAQAPAAEVSEILITGSRRSGMAVSDSPAPVQLISSEMLKESGSPDLMNAIATQVPSYNARQTGTDMASQTLTASMRALSANHALVLVNGKRRHITSNVGASTGNAAMRASHISGPALRRFGAARRALLGKDRGLTSHRAGGAGQTSAPHWRCVRPTSCQKHGRRCHRQRNRAHRFLPDRARP